MRIDSPISAVLLVSFAGAVVWSCAATQTPPSDQPETTGAGAGGGSTATTGAGGVELVSCAVPESDVIAPGVPENVISAFDEGTTDETAPPGVYEPRAETGLPRDWRTLYLLFRAEQAAYVELTLRVGDAKVRYIGLAADIDSMQSEAWRTALLPHDLWESVSCAADSASQNVEWELRSLAQDSSIPAGTAKGSITILPMKLSADVTFWQPAEGNAIARIKASTAKKQTIIDDDKTPTHKGDCIGCHATTPDGLDIVYERASEGALDLGDGGLPPDAGSIPPPLGDWRLAVVRPTGGGDSEIPAYLSATAKTALESECLERPSVSLGAWPKEDGSGRYIAASTCGAAPGELEIVELDAAGDPLHAVERAGDDRYAAEPAWAPTGDVLVYTSASSPATGPQLSATEIDLFRVPIDVAGGVFGGEATAIDGAADPDALEFHPSVSGDGKLVAFTRVPASAGGMAFGNPLGEIALVPATGGTATTLVGHDDPSIEDVYAGELTNTWPRFTQEVSTDAGGTYYAVAFSSRRGPGKGGDDERPFARMFFEFFRRDAAGQITSYGPVLIPGQTFDVHNLTIDARGLSSVEPPDDTK